uniref:Uncharacterized protein n=1 Tax=Rhizophora mucronata TaxID=61149 RepID=A0A2P2Q1Y7_RHIMU
MHYHVRVKLSFRDPRRCSRSRQIKWQTSNIFITN